MLLNFNDKLCFSHVLGFRGNLTLGSEMCYIQKVSFTTEKCKILDFINLIMPIYQIERARKIKQVSCIVSQLVFAEITSFED